MAVTGDALLRGVIAARPGEGLGHQELTELSLGMSGARGRVSPRKRPDPAREWQLGPTHPDPASGWGAGGRHQPALLPLRLSSRPHDVIAV